MAQYTAGELDDINYVAEVTYGAMPTGALAWAGRPLRIDPSVDMKRAFHVAPGSRSYGYTSSGPWDCGFETTCHTFSGTDWRTFWAVYAYGATTGTAATDTLGSFTAQTSVTTGATTYYHFWPGCKIDKLTIKATSPGMPFEFDAAIKAKWIVPDTNKVLTGYQSVTIGATATATTGTVNCWAANPLFDAVAFTPINYSVTVENHMSPWPSVTTGDIAYPVAGAMSEAGRDIILEFEIPSQDEAYTNAKLASTAVTSFAFTVGSYTITLTGGVYESNDIPGRKQDLMTEKVRIRFTTLTIT